MEISDIKRAIEGIKSVESCGIVTDSSGRIEEIHVVAGFDRSPKQISRDIQSVLISRFNAEIDHKKISIAQLRDVGSEKTEECRLRLKNISYSLGEGRCEAKVVLEKDDIFYEASEAGNGSRHGMQRVTSAAALKAAGRFLDREDLFSFEDVKVVEIAGCEVAVVSVIVNESGRDTRLFGCSGIGNDLNEAVVKATLNAINRKVIKYIDQ